MRITKDTNIGQLLATDYSYSTVFEEFAIDFFCLGNRSIEDAVLEQNLNLEHLLFELEIVKRNSIKDGIDYYTWKLDRLANHIEKSHHRYTEDMISQLKPLIENLVLVYGDKHTELLDLQKVFTKSAGEMASHMKKEELVLFPFIRKMVKSEMEQTNIQAPHFGTVINPVNMMIHEHEEQSKLLMQMRLLTNNFTLPEDPCNTYIAVYTKLQAFEKDMRKHLHLENNILFPKAVVLEGSLNKNY